MRAQPLRGRFRASAGVLSCRHDVGATADCDRALTGRLLDWSKRRSASLKRRSRQRGPESVPSENVPRPLNAHARAVADLKFHRTFRDDQRSCAVLMDDRLPTNAVATSRWLDESLLRLLLCQPEAAQSHRQIGHQGGAVALRRAPQPFVRRFWMPRA
jgi:hypothetical protein